MGAASNVFSTMLMQHGQQIRQQQQQDFDSRRAQHEWATNYLTAMSQNPLLDDAAREQYLRQLSDVGSIPIPKFDVQKVVKNFTKPIDDYHQRHGAMVAQAFPTSDQQQQPGQNGQQALSFPFVTPPQGSPQGAPPPQESPMQSPPMPDQTAAPSPQGTPGQALQPPAMPPPPGGDQGAPMSEKMPNGQPAMAAASPEPVLPFMSPVRQAQTANAVAEVAAAGQQKVFQKRVEQLRTMFPAMNDVNLLNIASGHPGTVTDQYKELNDGRILDMRTGQISGKPIPKFEKVGPGEVGGFVTPPMPGETPADGATGGFTPLIHGGAKLSDDQQAANAAYEAQRQKTEPGYKLAPADWAQAKSWYDEQSMTPTQLQAKLMQVENLKELQAERRLQEANLGMHIREFNLTHGPEAINSIVNQMKVDPDLYFGKDMTTDVRNQVAQAWTQQTGMPPPRELPAQVKTKEANSVIALNSVNRIKQMLVDNPVIQKRMGAWDGRVGNLEQAIGTTSGLSPQDAQKIQEFRSSVNYLFFQEGQALLQRTPQALMEELKTTSPNMKQGLPLFLGAIDAVKGTAAGNLQSANDYRFNRAPGSLNTSAPPNPPQGNPNPNGYVVGHVYGGLTYLGPDPNKQSSWKK